MNVIVDTNVPVVANKGTPQASARCIATCVQKLGHIQHDHTLVLDDGWHILKEYMSNLRSTGQPGVGDAFLKWVLANRSNPRRCTLVHITPQSASFAEFPSDPELDGFDLSDHKFVAIAIVHPDHPPILNASDSDWWHYQAVLSRYSVCIDFVCPDIQFRDS